MRNEQAGHEHKRCNKIGKDFFAQKDGAAPSCSFAKFLGVDHPIAHGYTVGHIFTYLHVANLIANGPLPFGI